MMHKLRIEAPHTAVLNNVNGRKENHGEEDQNAVDLKLTVSADEALARELFIEPESTQRSLWDDDGDLRDHELELTLASKAADQLVTIAGTGYEEMRFAPATVKLHKAVPQSGRVLDIIFTASVYPTVDQIGPLFDLQKRTVHVTVTNHQGDIDE